jgi:hypothetical protein
VDLLLHPADDPDRHRPHPGGRLSTVGHAPAFRAFARLAKRAGIRFMVIGGTFRDIAVRAGSTRDIDVVLVDQHDLSPEVMQAAGFAPVPGSPHAWRYTTGGRTVDLEIAAVASSGGTSPGPFSIVFRHAETRRIEGINAAVPRIEDYVILKLFAATANLRRRAHDLADVQYAIEAFPEQGHRSLSVPAIRARLRDVYGVSGERLKELVVLFRQLRRASTA